MAGSTQTISEYIVHHLTNLAYGKLPGGYERLDSHGDVVSTVPDGGVWTMAHSGTETAAMGFNAIHIDSMVWSIGLGIIFCWLFRSVAKKAHLVIVRDHGATGWLLEQMPEIVGKHVAFNQISEELTNYMTTGTVVSDLLCRAGCTVARIGFGPVGPSRVDIFKGQPQYPAVSREIALLHESGVDRKADL